MSFTKLRIPQLPQDDMAALAKAVVEHFRSLEGKGVISLEEASILASYGIKFPATQVPQTDANTLDDYEEGTWTPTDGSGAALSFTIDHATYTKIGRLVHGQAKLTYPVTASGANASISGLPFASAKATAAACVTTAGNVVYALIGASSTTVTPLAVNGAAVLNSALSTATLWINFSYYV